VIRVALRSLAGHKLRAALTALAIVLGVSMVSGTYVLTDTIRKSFDTIFEASYQNTSAVISAKTAFGSEQSNFGFSASLLPKVRALRDVAAADGEISDEAQLVDPNGKAIGTSGAPNLAFSIDPSEAERFSPLTLTAGRWPQGPHQIVIDRQTADSHDYSVGDRIGVVARGPEQQFRISGIAKFGAVSSIGGATLAIFDLPTAQRLFHKEGKFDSINVAAQNGVSPQALVKEIRPILPSTAQVKTGTQQAASDAHDVSTFLGYLQKFLLAFGGVALFVGAFVIANTLSITIAQRTREFAMLRAIGASKRQVRVSVLAESLVIGVLASLAGLVLGVALAKGLNAVFASVGFDLPKTGLVLETRTIVVTLAVGILVTLVASLRPAVRATRVPPIAAVREGATLPPSRLARLGRAPSLALLAAGAALFGFGVFAHGLATVERLLLLGGGAIGLFIGVALVSPVLIRPLANVLGWPGVRLGGVSGVLARDNAKRNPARTATTAAALMVGLALVSFVAVFGAGLRAAFERSVDEVFRANYVLTSQNGFTPLSASAGDALQKAPGITVSGVRATPNSNENVEAFGEKKLLSGVDPGISKVLKLNWVDGSQQTIEGLGRDGTVVSKDFARDHHLSVGSPFPLLTSTGKRIELTPKGIFDPPKAGSPIGDLTVSSKTFDRLYGDQQNVYTFIDIAGGVSQANTDRLERLLTPYPSAKLQTESQFKQNQEQGIDQVLNILYLLLALSVIVSLFGIVNTLVLTIFERTREIGMLRAVGMTRRQIRRMVRWESILTSLIGAALGIPIGVLLAVLIGHTISFFRFAFPTGSIVTFVIAALVVGFLAAIFPARRASRLNVLDALQHE
jgi:putative ABC transport system permease protein